ncbi:MAG: response regulator [Deltaproteobacteria bacterium]|nr:response regulator [Deltaproteobacteria bacterium]
MSMAQLLLVDDDDDISGPLVQLLYAEGHTIRVAQNGYEGLAAVAERFPDLILLDVEMPLLSGPEMALEMFIKDCGRELIPLLLISGAAKLKQIAETVGTPYMLEKPFKIEKLLSLVNQALHERVPPHPGSTPPGVGGPDASPS